MSEAAGALSCPDCGAPASPESTTCSYCGVALALVSCPNCLGRIFKGAPHCSHCGAEVPAPQALGEGSLHCPRCGVALAMVKVGTADLGECGTCGGTWVDGSTFEHIVAEKEEQARVLQAALPGFRAKTAQPRMDRYWPCPVCHKLMNRVNFGHVSGVVLDSCRTHGVWFDQDELRQLVEFLRSGGLDRARAYEQTQGPAAKSKADALADVAILQTEYEGSPDDPLTNALKVLDWIVRR